jgi:hypothetical protein
MGFLPVLQHAKRKRGFRFAPFSATDVAENRGAFCPAREALMKQRFPEGASGQEAGPCDARDLLCGGPRCSRRVRRGAAIAVIVRPD